MSNVAEFAMEQGLQTSDIAAICPVKKIK